jgi:hypothetical protein
MAIVFKVNYVITAMNIDSYLAEFLIAELTYRNTKLQFLDQQSMDLKDSCSLSIFFSSTISKLINHWKSLEHKQCIHMDSPSGDAFPTI